MNYPAAPASGARRQQIARTNFATLAALFNPATFARIEALGIGPGWHCWEAGAGGATVPLSRKVTLDFASPRATWVMSTSASSRGSAATSAP